MIRISQTENLDVLLVLAMAFENTVADPSKTTISQVAQKSFLGMPPEDFSAILKRANLLDELPTEKRELWRELCLEKLLRRGKSIRLDENINPVHIGNVLSREPQNIQKHILRNLPIDLSERIAQYLGLNFEPQNEKVSPIKNEIAELIKQEFFSNFVSFEDIYEPREIDRLSIVELAKFVHHLGLREVAIACRGISSKETLASFLNTFSPDDTREVVQYLTDLESIKPFWVAQADEIVRDNWDSNRNPEQIFEKIGFKLLTIPFVERDEIARQYTRQKFSSKDSHKWKKILRETENEFNKDSESKEKFDKRGKIVEKLAIRFIQTGRL